MFGNDVSAGMWQILVELVAPWELMGRMGMGSLALMITLTKIFHLSSGNIWVWRAPGAAETMLLCWKPLAEKDQELFSDQERWRWPSGARPAGTHLWISHGSVMAAGMAWISLEFRADLCVVATPVSFN